MHRSISTAYYMFPLRCSNRKKSVFSFTTPSPTLLSGFMSVWVKMLKQKCWKGNGEGEEKCEFFFSSRGQWLKKGIVRCWEGKLKTFFFFFFLQVLLVICHRRRQNGDWVYFVPLCFNFFHCHWPIYREARQWSRFGLVIEFQFKPGQLQVLEELMLWKVSLLPN